MKVRPELEKALELAHQFKEAAPETPVVFTVHELTPDETELRERLQAQVLQGWKDQ